jgi:hypothetical protein
LFFFFLRASDNLLALGDRNWIGCKSFNNLAWTTWAAICIPRFQSSIDPFLGLRSQEMTDNPWGGLVLAPQSGGIE